MKDPFDLRVATSTQAAAMTRLVHELGYTTSVGAFSGRLDTWLRDERCHVIVAQDAELEMVGWVAARRSVSLLTGDQVEIAALIVAENARRQGVGRRLVAAVETWCERIGAGTLVVRSNRARRAAHRFYAGLGFEKTKTQHVYRRALTGR